MKKLNTNKKGFTIIEVVLVLAIAGLIFMMVFIALPSLQRSQRDTQRQNDMSKVVTALQNYMTNNRGSLPTGTLGYVAGHTEQGDISSSSSGVTKEWTYFYDNYLMVNSGGVQDVFADPDGEPYSLWAVDCSTGGSPKQGDECNSNGSQRYAATFDQQAQALLKGEPSDGAVLNKTATDKQRGHAISVVKHATCEGEVTKYTTGSRHAAVVYKKEGGGVFCLAI